MFDSEKIKALRNGTSGRKRGYWTPEDNERLIWMFNEQYGITGWQSPLSALRKLL